MLDNWGFTLADNWGFTPPIPIPAPIPIPIPDSWGFTPDLFALIVARLLMLLMLLMLFMLFIPPNADPPEPILPMVAVAGADCCRCGATGGGARLKLDIPPRFWVCCCCCWPRESEPKVDEGGCVAGGEAHMLLVLEVVPAPQFMDEGC